MLGILVDGEARPERRQLEQDAVRLAEVDGAEPEAVDHRRRLHARDGNGVLPGLLLAGLRGDRDVMDGAGAADSSLCGWRIQLVETPPGRTTHFPRGSVGGCEPEHVLEQVAARLGTARE